MLKLRQFRHISFHTGMLNGQTALATGQFPMWVSQADKYVDDGIRQFYFSTNTSSMRVKQYMNNPNACIYFYHKGLFKYVGVMLKGKMEVLTDQETKNMNNL